MEDNKFLILTINPGSTSTKFAIYKNDQQLYKENIMHKEDELFQYDKVSDQVDFRYKKISELITNKINLNNLDAIVGRGGFLRPLSSGTYLVNDQMLEDLTTARYGEHASNLGALLANRFAKKINKPSYIVDPVVVDELEDVARLSGLLEIERKSHVHALNIKAVSFKVAGDLNQPLDKINLIVAHLGGGISVVAHKKGKLIDVNNANNEGPFSPERTGGLPSYQLVKLCYSGKYNEEELLAKLTKKGGVYDYLDTKDIRKVEEMINNGNKQAELVLEAMIYQIVKEIGAMAAVLEGQVTRIVLTGGISYSNYITERISKKIAFIAPVVIVPGEEELEALALGALRILIKKENVKTY